MIIIIYQSGTNIIPNASGNKNQLFHASSRVRKKERKSEKKMIHKRKTNNIVQEKKKNREKKLHETFSIMVYPSNTTTLINFKFKKLTSREKKGMGSN